MTSKTPVFSSPPDITCVCKLSWLKQLNGTELKLLMVINGLAQEEGHCYASDEYLAGCLGVKVRTVEDGLKSLEEKKWIFRNSWAVHKGSKRKIIPKDPPLSNKKVMNNPRFHTHGLTAKTLKKVLHPRKSVVHMSHINPWFMIPIEIYI